MAFKKDTTQVSGFTPGRIKKTGWHPLTINKAYEHDGKDGPSKSLFIDYVTDTGQTGQFYICYQTKQGVNTTAEGKPLSGLRDINDLMILCDLDTLDKKPGMVDIYDRNLKQDVKQKKLVYAALIGRHVGAIFKMKDEPAWDADNFCQSSTEFVKRPAFVRFCSDTGQSVAEYLGKEEPKSIEGYINSLLEDEHIIKQTSNQPNAPTAAALFALKAAAIDEDYDMPF